MDLPQPEDPSHPECPPRPRPKVSGHVHGLPAQYATQQDRRWQRMDPPAERDESAVDDEQPTTILPATTSATVASAAERWGRASPRQ